MLGTRPWGVELRGSLSWDSPRTSTNLGRLRVRFDYVENTWPLGLDLAWGKTQPPVAKFVVEQIAGMVLLESAVVELSTVDFEEEPVFGAEDCRSAATVIGHHEICSVPGDAADYRYLAPHGNVGRAQTLDELGLRVAPGWRFALGPPGENLAKQRVAGVSSSSRTESAQIDMPISKRVFERELDEIASVHPSRWNDAVEVSQYELDRGHGDLLEKGRCPPSAWSYDARFVLGGPGRTPQRRPRLATKAIKFPQRCRRRTSQGLNLGHGALLDCETGEQGEGARNLAEPKGRRKCSRPPTARLPTADGLLVPNKDLLAPNNGSVDGPTARFRTDGYQSRSVGVFPSSDWVNRLVSDAEVAVATSPTPVQNIPNLAFRCTLQNGKELVGDLRAQVGRRARFHK